MTVGKCVLCGKIRKCSPKEIEHQEYDVCAFCWKALESKLQGRGRIPRVRVWKALESKLQEKGRPRRSREWVWLPPVQAPSIEAPTKAVPGHPPTIWGALPTA